MDTIRYWAVLLACCAGPMFVAFSLLFWWRRRQAEHSKLPFRELGRRPPGEALRLRIAELDEKLLDRAFLFVGLPMVIWGVLLPWHQYGLVLPFVALFACAAIAVFLGVRLRDLIKERAQYQLGFEGERYVGEELTQLIAHDFAVYHDVPFEGFNVDHVLVGPPGVFAIETKTRRKPIGDYKPAVYRVEFDGKVLRWPWGSESQSVEQAVNNARSLSQWLSSAVGERVRVTPIVTMPGWWVDRISPPNGVHVLNPKEIINMCQRMELHLSEVLVRRICHQLNQKCRIAMEEASG